MANRDRENASGTYAFAGLWMGGQISRSMTASSNPPDSWSFVFEVAVKPAGVLAICEIADLDLRLAPGRPETVLGHIDRHATTNDVTSGAEPRPLLELQPHR